MKPEELLLTTMMEKSQHHNVLKEGDAVSKRVKKTRGGGSFP
jgi:hypothetical protein